MASSGPHRRSNSMELPPTIAEAFRLREEFFRVFVIDHPRLQQCIKKLQNIIRTFEEDFKVSTEGSRDAGVKGIAGASALAVGIGLALAPLKLGASLAVGLGVTAVTAVAVAGAVSVAVTGAVVLTAAGITSNKCSSERKEQMKILRQNIEAQLKEFQNKIKRMAEKMKDLHQCTEEILEDFKKLEREASALTKKQLEDLAELTEKMSEDMRLITLIAEIYGGFNLVLDMISVIENTRALKDMDRLAETPIDEETDEQQIRSKAGKFMVEIRKLIHQLQNIIDELEKTKHKLSSFQKTI